MSRHNGNQDDSVIITAGHAEQQKQNTIKTIEEQFKTSLDYTDGNEDPSAGEYGVSSTRKNAILKDIQEEFNKLNEAQKDEQTSSDYSMPTSYYVKKVAEEAK